MYGLFPAPLTELLKFNLALNLLLVFMGIIIPPFADGTAKRDQVIRIFDLCHIGK
jgi:hypothetical protein